MPHLVVRGPFTYTDLQRTFPKSHSVTSMTTFDVGVMMVACVKYVALEK